LFEHEFGKPEALARFFSPI